MYILWKNTCTVKVNVSFLKNCVFKESVNGSNLLNFPFAMLQHFIERTLNPKLVSLIKNACNKLSELSYVVLFLHYKNDALPIRSF